MWPIVNGIMGLSQEIIGAGLTGGVSAAVAGLKGFTTVPEGHMGVRTRWSKATRTKDDKYMSGKEGELYGIVGPGFKWVCPFMHSIQPVSTRTEVSQLGNLTLDHAQKQLLIRSSVSWNVDPGGDNPYRALYNVAADQEREQVVVQLCESGLRKVLQGKNQAEIEQLESFDADMKKVCTGGLIEYGIVLSQARLLEVRASDMDVLRQGLAGMHGALGGLAVDAETRSLFDHQFGVNGNGSTHHLGESSPGMI